VKSRKSFIPITPVVTLPDESPQAPDVDALVSYLDWSTTLSP
jgi:hypothetical protein